MILESSVLGATVICSDIARRRQSLQQHRIYCRRCGGATPALKFTAATDAERFRRAGEAQRDHVSRIYAWDPVVDEYEDVFRSEAGR